MTRILCLTLLVAACHDAPPPSPKPAAVVPKLDHAGDECGSNQTCPDGLSCLHYYPGEVHREPGVYRCWLPCSKDADCPTGTTCGVTIEAGPSICHR